MYKKILIAATLMLGVSVSGFAGGKQPEELYSTRADLAKKVSNGVLMDKQMKALEQIQSSLTDGKNKFEFSNADKNPQFFYQEDLIDANLGAKHNFKDVYNKLCKNKSAKFVFDKNGISVGKFDYAVKNGKKQEIDSNKLIVPVTFEARTIDGVSDARYRVTFNWCIPVEKKTKTIKEADGKKTEITEYKLKGENKIALQSVSPTPISYMNSEANSMVNAAKDEIVKWYRNLPANLDEKYAAMSVTPVEAMSVTGSEIKLDKPAGQKFTVSNVPVININVDPAKLLDDWSPELYDTDQKATVNVTPVFTVVVDNTFKNAEIVEVRYNEGEAITPIPYTELQIRKNKAADVVADLYDNLSAYVVSRDKEQKNVIENMFSTPKSEVQVSYLQNNGKEKIKKETVSQYLTLLKGTALNINNEDFNSSTPDWSSVVCTVSQDYKGDKYSDNTTKQIYLVYDPETGSYTIEKIEVVADSTKAE